MKRILIVASLSLAATGCDGDILKRIARAILEDEQPQQTQVVVQQPAQQQPVEVVQQPAQQHPTTIVVQTETPQPQQQVQVVQQAKPQQTANATHYIQTKSDGYVYMRSQPETNAKRIKKLNDGTRVRMINCNTDYTVRTDAADYGQDGYWCKVSANGTTGYVFSAYLYDL